jgi:hypothetical protein
LSATILATGIAYGASGIGMVTGQAAFYVNGSQVTGNATLFDGTIVKTAAAASKVQLEGGATFQLSPHSQAKIFANRIVLENGWGDFRPAGAARVEARGLMVAAAEAGTVGRVALHGVNLVQVASSKGMLRVYNPVGILVANVRPGRALDFDPQAGSSETKVSGCLMKKDGKWVVLDDTTQTLFELQGSGFEREWGNRIEVTGTAKLVGQPGAGSVQAIQVSNFKQVGTGGCLTAAAQTNSQLPGQNAPAEPRTSSPTSVPKPAGGGGMSAGAKIAIAVVAIGGGAGAAIALAGHGNRS